MSREHELKIWPEHFGPVERKEKPFEVRKNDRDYQVGDILVLKEWSMTFTKFSGHEVRRRVTYVLHGGVFGLEIGYVVLGLGEE